MAIKIGDMTGISWGALFLALLAVVTLGGCQKNSEPLKIGFAGPLTGRLADIGVSGRDGAQLAIDEANAAGGINGRKLVLVPRDDRQNPEEAVRVDRELVGEGVVAIIGHMTSSMSIAGAPVADEAKLVMISPTTGANDLTGLDDHFLRVYPPTRRDAEKMAVYANKTVGRGRMAVVYDEANLGHAEGWYRYFKAKFESLGGNVLPAMTFNSGHESRMLDLGKKIAIARPDGLLVITGALDAAAICQQLHKLDAHPRLFATEWSSSDELLVNGGSAVEGMTCFIHFNKQDTSPAYSSFREAYVKRFGREPVFGAAFGYETAQLLVSALRKVSNPAKLKEAVLAIGKFQGLQGSYTIDRFGDAERAPILITVKNGRFARVE